jgi:beta-N-acetylhexosaminidase
VYAGKPFFLCEYCHAMGVGPGALEEYWDIIYSDDIFMGALADNGYPPETAVVMAIEAGIDCIMISEKRFAKAGKVLYQRALQDQTFARKIDKAVTRILKYKIKAGLLDEAEIR